ncbi:MAG: Re/Si-specific NAD(P)(+) transhydrogenase subunit alpha [Marmoricola sp.]
MKIAVARETRAGETRVALVPDLVAKVTGLGHEVLVEPGAGEGAEFGDEEYADAGAVVTEDAVDEADVVISVQPLDEHRIRHLRPDLSLISFLPVNQSLDLVAKLRDQEITAFAMELVPRISRAQSMDALSSQALVAGYRCAVVAAGLLRRFFPLNMTAAGTVQPAEVVVIGAGVAGLQAIATAKRLGAVVSAYDVRAAAAEEIRSVGAKAIDLDLETLEGTGGYAREMTEDRAARQKEMLAPYIAGADALITTAAVPGRQAPLLVTRPMVEQMKPGSVVVDLAAESGGNVEGSEPGKVVRVGQAQVWGGANVPASMPVPASRLYAQNVVNLLTLMTRPGEEGEPAAFEPDFDDEIVAGCCVTRAGRILHQPTREAIEGPDEEPGDPADAEAAFAQQQPEESGLASEEDPYAPGTAPDVETDYQPGAPPRESSYSEDSGDLPFDQEADRE